MRQNIMSTSKKTLCDQGVIPNTRILAANFCLAARKSGVLLGMCLASVFFSTSAVAQKNCEDIEFAGVKLGMSYKQARAGLIKHFNLSPSDAQKKIHASNYLAIYHPSLRGKKNPTEAEIFHATLETPVQEFDYNCKTSQDMRDLQVSVFKGNTPPLEEVHHAGYGRMLYGDILDGMTCSNEFPSIIFSSSITPDLSQPDAVTRFAYRSRTLTKGEVVAKLGSPDPCNDDPKDCARNLRWDDKPRRSCSWKGKEVEWYASLKAWGRESNLFWELSLSLKTDFGDRKGALKMIQDREWLKAKGWLSEEVELERFRAMCRQGLGGAMAEQSCKEQMELEKKGK
jgi:hypothetical protein